MRGGTRGKLCHSLRFHASPEKVFLFFRDVLSGRRGLQGPSVLSVFVQAAEVLGEFL